RESGRNAEAIAAYERAIAARPTIAEAYNNLGSLYTQTGQTPRAIPVLRKAVQLKSGWSEAHANLGTALQDAGEFPAALESLRTAIALDPSQKAARARAIQCERAMCDWRSDPAEIDPLLEHATPFSLLGLVDDPQKLRVAARAHAK